MNSTENAMTTTTIYYDTQDPNNSGWAYRIEGPHDSMSGAIDGLDDLLTVLRDVPRDHAFRIYARNGAPSERLGDEADLPNFGGLEPEDTEGVWSWDETRMLVGTCCADYAIVARSEVA